MGIFDDATREYADRLNSDGERDSETTIGAESITIADSDTQQTTEDTWLSGKKKYGWPRGREAYEARQIQQTWAMEVITNGIVDQLLGGELAAENEGDDDLTGPAADLWNVIRDVLKGPHLMDDTLDDLISAAVADMVGPGNAYWDMLPAENASIPVAALKPVDALTVRHNYDENGNPKDPAYWQAAGAFGGAGNMNMGNVSPTPLTKDDIVAMRYPGSRRSFRVYPQSPAMQVKKTLELLANSTSHHNRFYNDDEIPAGFVQIMGASDNSVSKIQDKIQAAAGDPRSVEVIGGEGAAQWIEMGGTAINLNVIEEQKWFLQLCLAAFGLGKAEIGMIEDVNRANGDVEASRVFKRVTGPFAKEFSRAFGHIADQFEVYRQLDRPFDIRLRFSDPREERAREERLLKMYEAGGLTRREWYQRRGDGDVAEGDMTVEINGQEVDYGALPKDVLDHKLRSLRGDTPEDQAEDQAEDMPSEDE
ncbi:phage portal protein [Natronoarchaeum rubrum]|uniref:phage portal protein n=1 Tax=Natronoarchaeum rubrum TaxID=755311 RepID=UPI0021134198|nr:phage portal protein [Natronoarchaeum rubrum]